MQKKAKKVLGACGLLAVGAITTFAAFLPAPETSAVSAVTDTIVVRVIPGSPEVSISGITNGEVFVEPEVTFKINYAASQDVNLEIYYKNLEGGERTKTLGELTPDYDYGEDTYTINLRKLADFETQTTFALRRSASEPPFSYGYYKLTLVGSDSSGASDTHSVEFYYLPVQAKVEKDNGKYYLNLDYEYDDGENAETDGAVNKLLVQIKDEDGNVVKEFWVNDGVDQVELPFTEGGDTKDYEIVITAYDRNNNKLHESISVYVEDVNIPTTGGEVEAPDTGIFGGKLNILKKDYLITGLIIFGIVVIAGVVFVMRGGKQKTHKK